MVPEKCFLSKILVNSELLPIFDAIVVGQRLSLNNLRSILHFAPSKKNSNNLG